MSAAGRPPAAPLGKTRVCPHCKATVLESASVCPGCRHHLRFDPGSAQKDPGEYTAWKVDGVIGSRAAGEPAEYCIVVAVQNEQGREIARQVVAVGALQPDEKRAFTLSVEVMPPRAAAPAPPSRTSPAAPAVAATASQAARNVAPSSGASAPPAGSTLPRPGAPRPGAGAPLRPTSRPVGSPFGSSPATGSPGSAPSAGLPSGGAAPSRPESTLPPLKPPTPGSGRPR